MPYFDDSLTLSNMKKSFGFHECGPKGLSNFGCLPEKCFTLNYHNSVMDEQENGKIGFNYVHFLFSIATSEKDKKGKS